MRALLKWVLGGLIAAAAVVLAMFRIRERGRQDARQEQSIAANKVKLELERVDAAATASGEQRVQEVLTAHEAAVPSAGDELERILEQTNQREQELLRRRRRS